MPRWDAIAPMCQLVFKGAESINCHAIIKYSYRLCSHFTYCSSVASSRSRRSKERISCSNLPISFSMEISYQCLDMLRDDELLKISEVAAILGFSDETVRKHIRKGRIEYQQGRPRTIKVADLRKFIGSRNQVTLGRPKLNRHF